MGSKMTITPPRTNIDPVRNGEARIARLFEMTSDLLATISLDDRFTLLNPAWEQLLGWTREELQARPIQEFMHPDDVECRSEEHTSELQSLRHLVCRLLLEK